MSLTVAGISGNRTHQWGGIAFALGNILFLVNKLDEMSRLFLGRWMPDVISEQDSILILLGQTFLIIGYVSYYQFYSGHAGRAGKIALRLFCGGGIVLAIGHVVFMSDLQDALPPSIRPFGDYLFLLVMFGLLFLLIGLIWFGILNLRQPILSNWRWLPLITGLMGFIGFVLFSGEDITPTFLVFRTLFALGLIGLGVVLWLGKPDQL